MLVFYKGRQSITCLCWYICSMGNKQKEFEVHAHLQTYNIIGITEMYWGSLHDWSGPGSREGQQEGLLQIHWQQKEDQGNHEVMAQCGMGPKDMEDGHKDMEKAEILNRVFASVFNGNVCSEASQLFESSGRDWEGDT